ncbi:MAG: ABC transporter permease [Gammaproteobacteria bacterium]|nr:ABC transporter permease [Gammaproteobacteria bacterium]MDH4313906.1 ABC transporter permease [Gammaproteobacteria bacterium]MDH5213819.1 ABC transporter permease [Gammaproteobacteria bacterium]
MEIGPIWRAMSRNKTSYLLIAMQIAVTMAIMVNAFSIIQERSRMMARPSGVDEDNIFYLSSIGFLPEFDGRSASEEDLDALRRFPGVANAIMTNTVPLQGGGWSQGLRTEPGEEIESIGVAVYFVDEHGIDTFDVNLTQGRNFAPTEIMMFDPDANGARWPDKIIITQAMAEALFPDSPNDAIGRTVYIEDDLPITIIGVLQRMQAAWKEWSGVERAMLVPMKRKQNSFRYVIRAEPGYRDELMPQIEKMLAEKNTGRIIRGMTTMTETRERSYLEDSAMIKLLVFIVGVLTAITGLGIVGLASFSVARRSKQIGVRRALGATRPAILRYFMLENFLISSVGVVGGALLAVGLNVWMVHAFDLTPIAWYVIPTAMLILWLVGQLAVFGPARRATLVSPAVATRAV